MREMIQINKVMNQDQKPPSKKKKKKKNQGPNGFTENPTKTLKENYGQFFSNPSKKNRRGKNTSKHI